MIYLQNFKKMFFFTKNCFCNKLNLNRVNFMQKQKGFTLIELAIVMIIIGLLIGVGVSLLPGLINQQKYTQNQSLLNQNYNAIIGFIIKNGRAPFASNNATNGEESKGTANGYFPYITVGGLQKDAYGNTFYYAVNTQLASTNSTTTFCQTLMNINKSNSNVNTINSPNQTISQSIPDVFVLISSGANNKLDPPNSIAPSNHIFASEQYPLSQNYDDMVKSLSVQQAISLFSCQNATLSSTPPPSQSSACSSCVSNCKKSLWWCNTFINICNNFCYLNCSSQCS